MQFLEAAFPGVQVRRYREALILAGVTNDSSAGRSRGMDPQQLEALAERMALDFMKSSGSEDPVRFCAERTDAACGLC